MRHITAAEVRQFLVERCAEISLKEFAKHLKPIQPNVSDA